MSCARTSGRSVARVLIHPPGSRRALSVLLAPPGPVRLGPTQVFGSGLIWLHLGPHVPVSGGASSGRKSVRPNCPGAASGRKSGASSADNATRTCIRSGCRSKSGFTGRQPFRFAVRSHSSALALGIAARASGRRWTPTRTVMTAAAWRKPMSAQPDHAAVGASGAGGTGA